MLNLAQPLSTRSNSLPLSSSEGSQGRGVPQGVAPSGVPARRAALLAPAAALLGPSAPARTLNMASIPPIRCPYMEVREEGVRNKPLHPGQVPQHVIGSDGDVSLSAQLVSK